jgi:electron transfer flavoprotein beta subunit
MKILVCIKRVADANVKIRVKADGTGVDLSNVKMSMNPFCETAIEEAVRLKEKWIASEVVAVSIGGAAAQDVLRAALAMGADRALLIQTDTMPEPLAVAKLLKVVAQKEKPDLILMGKQSIDGDNAQTGAMLAALLTCGQATCVSKIEKDSEGVVVTREIDGGTETLALKIPCVVTADLRLNTPRYASLPNIMKARQKPLAVTAPEELGVDISPRTVTLKIEEPPKRKAGIKVKDVAELVDKLKNEAKVI